MFVTVPALVTGTTLAAAAALAHDVAACAVQRGRMPQTATGRVVRCPAVAAGTRGVWSAIAAQGYTVHFPVLACSAVPASTVLPALSDCLFGARYNSAGLLWSA